MSADPRLGVFDSLLAVGERPIAVHAHLARIASSAATLYGSISGPPEEEVRRAASAAVLSHRVRVTARPTTRQRVDWDIALERARDTLADPPTEDGVGLAAVRTDVALGPHKWADRRPVTELMAGEGDDADDVLLIDRAGLVLECGRANIFALVGDGLVTPPCDGRILPGIARRVVIELARAQGVPVDIRPFAAAELRRAAEVFVTNSICGVKPVTRCTGSMRMLWRPGPLADQLRAALVVEWLGRAPVEVKAP